MRMRSQLLSILTCLLGTLNLSLFGQVFSEKIIIFHHMASYSHRVQTWPLAEALSKRGHEVTYISPFYPKEPNPNITELVPTKLQETVNNVISTNFDINLKIRGEMENMIEYMAWLPVTACESIYTSPDFKRWLLENPKADLVIIDNIYVECGIGLSYKLGTSKYIFFSTLPVLAYEYDTIGFLPEASVIPETETHTLRRPLGFLDRISNALESLRWKWNHYYYVEKLDKLIRKELDVGDMPYVEDLIRNTSLIFYTGDVVTDFPRSLPPLFVNVAGIHARKSTNSLPKEMEEFISSNSTKSQTNDPDDGFIYISLGSMIVSSELPEDIKKVFYDVIRTFPHIKFLWKWDGDFPKEIPENLYLSKWFPQVDILGHPKIRGFVTQCGRPSLMEALFNGVPMISYPIIGDQEINADRLSEMGAMVRLDITNVNYDDLKEGVEKVLYDVNMKARVKRLREIFLDRPMSPVDTAVWWTEYVLRNEDTSHLRPVGNDQYWFVRRQIDVWATLSISAFVIFVGSAFISWKVLSAYVQIPKKLKNN